MLNPILLTERVLSDFLKYQCTSYGFADKHFDGQLKRLLNLEQSRKTPLLKGPFISLARAFKAGPSVATLVHQGKLHPLIRERSAHPFVYDHQARAIDYIRAGRTTLISTGTGSGKTECFLFPIISRCLELRDAGVSPGITAVIVYPMNALAEDQLGRMRDLLAGTGITFGLYVGKTPEGVQDITGERLAPGSSREDYRERLKRNVEQRRTIAVHPVEERVSREELRQNPPQILLTNVKQLELLLTRKHDIELFDGARLEYLVFDEAHTFRGVNGAETACLIRRLRAYCGQSYYTTCVATSATLVDPERGPEAARDFAARFFGVAPETVELVTEQYEGEDWAKIRKPSPPPKTSPDRFLKSVLDAVANDGPEAGTTVRVAFNLLVDADLDESRWPESLYDHLAQNELVYQVSLALRTPRLLSELLQDLRSHVGREVAEEELLAWLALGAAARRGGRPLLRPVVHAFVRGVEGAVVTFPISEERPTLWLSAKEAQEQSQSVKVYTLPILTCSTCGQHYFEHFVRDFTFLAAVPGGGESINDGRSVRWEPLTKAHNGSRVILMDRPTFEVEEGDESDDDELPELGANAAIPATCAEIWFCRCCGTLHRQNQPNCSHCGTEVGLARLLAVRQKEKNPGYLCRCISCGTNGRMVRGSFREPARPVRATAVADVHVLAQNILQQLEQQRLLIFSDNRQDAAFQAGWMLDHARRFRMRSLLFDQIRNKELSIGDLTHAVDSILEKDDDLSQALAPEVWRFTPREAAGNQHQEDRKKYIRIQVLRELVLGVKQRLGLEPWGRMQLEYMGLHSGIGFFQNWSHSLNCTAEALLEGVTALLDVWRRAGALYDSQYHLFSRIWADDENEVIRGYFSKNPGWPKALALQRLPTSAAPRLIQFFSQAGETLGRQVAKKFGVVPDDARRFLEDLWACLISANILKPVTLTGYRGRALPDCAHAHQIDGDRIRMHSHQGYWRCTTCQRIHLRETVGHVCIAWRCSGLTEFVQEDPNNYNLRVLEEGFVMLRPREHSAQVPAEKREETERLFKSDSERLNTLVCTQTLEMGVDIGGLDAVLMRNVPPLPSNYWQRAGRAGRRNRLAVNFTYCRAASHDRAYFEHPLKLLGGTVMPPRFNLRNELMLRKHLHATVLTRLNQISRENGEEGESIEAMLRDCFPRQTKHYFFDELGKIRPRPVDVSSLQSLINRFRAPVLSCLVQTFGIGWPAADATLVEETNLARRLDEMPGQLAAVIERLWRRLRWAIDRKEALESQSKETVTLTDDLEAERQRCLRYIRRQKGEAVRGGRGVEGRDDINTYSVLAAEGFLPGYGLETGSVKGFALPPRATFGGGYFELPRNPSQAIREHAPGNMIYANGSRFVPRTFHFDQRTQQDAVKLLVSPERESVAEMTGEVPNTLSDRTISAVPVPDVDLIHQSQISDEEDYRFQMPVAVYGYERGFHGSGKSFRWGSRMVSYRSDVSLRLVNTGPASRVQTGTFGFPVCMICGQSTSPFSSTETIQRFQADHLERCRQAVSEIGLFADVTACAITLQDCNNRVDAFSIAEALRMGASRVIEMEVDDLQVLCIGRSDSEKVDLLLYDPMPGGSGLLDQLLEQWPEVCAEAIALASDCSSGCRVSCIECLQTFRNAYYHRHLDRHRAIELIEESGPSLEFSNDIPAKHSGQTRVTPSGNSREVELIEMLARAGFSDPELKKAISLGARLTTYPDLFFPVPDHRKEGLCLYLDGTGRHLHGNASRLAQDREMRDLLASEGYEVITINEAQMSDQGAMQRVFFRIGQVLAGRERAIQIRDNPTWFNQ